MEMIDLYNYTQQHEKQFTSAETFADFANSLDASAPGAGRWLQHVNKTYPGSWERAYRTIKRHGFQSRELLLPDATRVSDIFESAKLYPSGGAGGFRRETPYVADGAAFVSALRAPGFCFSGHLGAEYTKGRFGHGCISGGEWYLTGAKPTQAVVDVYGGCGSGEWDLATFEIVKREGGELLVVVNSHNGFGSRWLCILDAGESCFPLFTAKERETIKAELARKAEAFGEE